MERKKRACWSSTGCTSKGQDLVWHQCGQNPLTACVGRLLLSMLRCLTSGTVLFLEFFIEISCFCPLCWAHKPGEEGPRVENISATDNTSAVVFIYYLISAVENLSNLTALICTCLRGLSNELLIKGVVMGWGLSESTRRSEMLLWAITYWRSRREGCPEACGGAAPWAVGSCLSCILPVVSCPTLWLTEYP